MTNSNRVARHISVSFLPQTEAIIRRVKREMAFDSFSGALRFIVHDWDRRVSLPAGTTQGGNGGGEMSVEALAEALKRIIAEEEGVR